MELWPPRLFSAGLAHHRPKCRSSHTNTTWAPCEGHGAGSRGVLARRRKKEETVCVINLFTNQVCANLTGRAQGTGRTASGSMPGTRSTARAWFASSCGPPRGGPRRFPCCEAWIFDIRFFGGRTHGGLRPIHQKSSSPEVVNFLKGRPQACDVNLVTYPPEFRGFETSAQQVAVASAPTFETHFLVRLPPSPRTLTRAAGHTEEAVETHKIRPQEAHVEGGAVSVSSLAVPGSSCGRGEEGAAAERCKSPPAQGVMRCRQEGAVNGSGQRIFQSACRSNVAGIRIACQPHFLSV